MSFRSRLPFLPTLTLVTSLLFLPVLSSQAQVENVLHTFEGPDGAYPEGELTFDNSGNLYGTTADGGTYGNGTVFEMSPVQGGGWDLQVLYSFTGGTDGYYPRGSLIFDGNGNLYGTTQFGGSSGNGNVFRLSPPNPPGLTWTETTLYSFGAFPGDGTDPVAGLIFDPSGNLYGTTALGGGSSVCASGCGSVYELTPTQNDAWIETLLYSFSGQDGFSPQSQLVFDQQGDLYGTTAAGGKVCAQQKQGCGLVFELTPSGGTWIEKVIHLFHGPDGAIPLAGVIFDSEGNLYGAAAAGGLIPCDIASAGCGTVFRLHRGANDWNIDVLHVFGGQMNNDGAAPVGRLIFDTHGKLYGSTNAGGVGWGTVFQLRLVSGQILESIYDNFGPGPDGEEPNAGVTLDQSGNVYGTTSTSYPVKDGIVFELTR